MKKYNYLPDSAKTTADFLQLTAGRQILFSGIFYTARDQAHSRLIKLISTNKPLPINLDSKIIYYCGPTPAKDNEVIGSCGPTTSLRMDDFVEPLLKKGLLAMVGKGRRSKQVKMLIKKYKKIYFVAPSGCGALLSTKVISRKIICFNDLGPEAIQEIKVKDFPLIVAIDSKGKSIYENA